MDTRLSILSKKMNLYDDDVYEDFRDVLTDNAVNESATPLTRSEVRRFGNGCRLEGVSNKSVEIKNDENFLSGIISSLGRGLDSLSLIHSELRLHMQAEEHIKIDIIWAVETEPTDNSQEYIPVAVFFEDNGEGAFDEGPNYDPMDNGSWDEFLYDMGIGPDPFSEDQG